LERVVICFKISIFALSDTTEVGFLCGCRLLWFALKLVSLHYQTQRSKTMVEAIAGCDLL